MSTAKSQSQLITTINGIELKTNSIYRVLHKPDRNAPSGLVEEGATKLPSRGIGNTISIKAVISDEDMSVGNYKNFIYDTGLFEESPCYRGLEKGLVREKVKALQEYVVEPYESYKNNPELLDHNNSSFWDSYLTFVTEGRIFNTSNPEQLFALYVCLQTRELAPLDPKERKAPQFKNAQYCVVDVETADNHKKKRATKEMDTIGKFFTLLTSNPSFVKNIMVYLNLIPTSSSSIEAHSLKTRFHEWIKQDKTNCDVFLELVNQIEDDKVQKEVVNLYPILRKLFISKHITKTKDGQYMFGTDVIGGDLKGAARNLVQNEDLQEVKGEILLLNE